MCIRDRSKEYREVRNSILEFYTGEEQNIQLLELIYEYEKRLDETNYSSFEEWKLWTLEQRGSDGVNPIIHTYQPLKKILDSIGVTTFDDFLYDLGYPPYKKEWYDKKITAVEFAKNQNTYCKASSKCKDLNNDKYIKTDLSEKGGIITSIGWNSKIVGDGIYLVTYTYKENGKSFIYALEVNLPIESVRNIFNNDFLIKKYWEVNNKYNGTFKEDKTKK